MDRLTLERSARNREEMDQSNMARRLWHVVRAVLFMLRKGMSKRKLAMDLNLLLHRGKIAGKAFSKLMNTHHHQHDKSSAGAAVQPPQYSSAWCAVDPALAVYDPRRNNREVEFSCSNTPSYPSFQFILPTAGGKRRRRNNRRAAQRGANGDQPGWYNYDAADIARVFEILNHNEQLLSSSSDDDASAAAGAEPSPLALVATPSPALWASFGRTPAHVKQLRITDSPFPLRDDAAAGEGQVDLEAEQFIKKFYEQLRRQQSLAGTTPDYGYARPVTGMA